MIQTGAKLQQRYKIDKQIGQGGMGAVYVATDERFGSIVAIKETLCEGENFRKAIEREARLLNSLKHSSLPRVSDHFEDDDGLFLVMEYIPGEDVAAMLESDNESFSVNQVLNWADQLLDALDYLHNQELPVIHRDIKPQNLKINSRGDIILLDFGLAKGNPTDASHQTAAKSIFGYSRNYASLEQIQGTGTDPRSDLYSLAATLYHMITGAPPADALTRAMSVLSKNPDPLDPASSVNSAVPKGIAGVLQMALDLDANDRPASAHQMRQMLSESERYAYLADRVNIGGQLTDPRVFAQQTKLMPAATDVGTPRESGATTAAASHYNSQITALRSVDPNAKTDISGANTTAPTPSAGRGMGMLAGALMMLIAGVVIGGGLYMVNPALFGNVGDDTTPIDQPRPVPVRAETNVEIIPNPSPLVSEPGSAADDAVDQPLAADSTRPQSKPPESTKNVKPLAAVKPRPEKDLGEVVEIQVNDPDIPPGGIVMTERDENGNTKTMRITRQGPPPNSRRPMPPDRANVFPRAFEFEHLSPEQKRKLQRILKDNPKVKLPATPKPRSTPLNP